MDVYFLWREVRLLESTERSAFRDVVTNEPVKKLSRKYLSLGGGWANMEFHYGPDGGSAIGLHPMHHSLEVIAGRGLLMAFKDRDTSSLMESYVHNPSVPLDVVVHHKVFMPAALLMLDKYGW